MHTQPCMKHMAQHHHEHCLLIIFVQYPQNIMSCQPGHSYEILCEKIGDGVARCLWHVVVGWWDHRLAKTQA
jgi:hypothetical protein